MFYAYVLKSLKNGRNYVGSTDNLNRRICEHNSGQSKYTSSTRPFRLVYFERFKTRIEAVQREMFLKSGKGREFLKKSYWW